MEDNLFEDIDKHLLEDEKPSEYIKKNLHRLKGSNFGIINELELVEQNPTYHPEGNVLIHTLLVVDGAAMVRRYASDKRALMWAALFHDIGKKKATKIKKGKITSYDHDKYGAEKAKELLEKYEFLNEEFTSKVSSLVSYHMHGLYITRNLPFGNTEQMIKTVELHDMMLLFFADKLGKGQNSKEDIRKAVNGVNEIIKQLEKKYHVDMEYTIKCLKELIS